MKKLLLITEHQHKYRGEWRKIFESYNNCNLKTSDNIIFSNTSANYGL